MKAYIVQAYIDGQDEPDTYILPAPSASNAIGQAKAYNDGQLSYTEVVAFEVDHIR